MGTSPAPGRSTEQRGCQTSLTLRPAQALLLVRVPISHPNSKEEENEGEEGGEEEGKGATHGTESAGRSLAQKVRPQRPQAATLWGVHRIFRHFPALPPMQAHCCEDDAPAPSLKDMNHRVRAAKARARAMAKSKKALQDWRARQVRPWPIPEDFRAPSRDTTDLPSYTGGRSVERKFVGCTCCYGRRDINAKAIRLALARATGEVTRRCQSRTALAVALAATCFL